MTADALDRIVEQNLGVYRAAPSRLQEDVSQEAQVTSDYRGRLVYELLQNADDAMADQKDAEDRVSFLITDEDLWIANSGRPLTDDDVQGLCGLGASSKVDAHGVRRASIGHKGLGFKSVLEITDRPAVYSTTYSFELGAAHARQHVERLWQQLGSPAPRSVPAMRFPSRLDEAPEMWADYQTSGFNTAFRFPFTDDLGESQRSSLADLLLDLPLTTVLFLKHLERVEVEIRQHARSVSRSWQIRRERWEDGAWRPSVGLGPSDLYRVAVEADDGESATFLVAHDADVEIGDHRTGLTGPAWDGVALTEVSVATLVPADDVDTPIEWRRFHVFLPTEELCPYPLLVNGAFTTDLSRQQLRVSSDQADYNSHLIRNAARLVREQLLPVLLQTGPEAVLSALDRQVPDSVTSGEAAALFHTALVQELAEVPLLPTELGEMLAFSEAVLPPTIMDVEGSRYREVLVEDPVWEGHRFPSAPFCTGRWARVAADHGATELSPAESAGALAALHDPVRSSLVEDDSGGFELDPLLELCTVLWERATPSDRSELESRARAEPLFPVHRSDDRTVDRVALEGETAFYPPRSARHDLPLQGLRFMCHSICWGALLARERISFLESRMKAWTALFEIKEFRFEEVMRAAVIPALVLNPDNEAMTLLESLRDIRSIAAVCQLAGSYAKPDRPLRYQRLQSDRALFNLSRLPVPCRSQDGEERWLPAYKVYFGKDWIGDASVELIAEAVPDDDPADQLIDFAYLAPPEQFMGTLGDLGEPQTADAGTEAGDDEVGLDEDTDQALETNERDRWIAFLSWIGANQALRPVHFHDVEDDATGWLTTKGLAQPQGWAFRQLGPTWTAFREQLEQLLKRRPDARDVVPYLYEAHDLEAIVPLVEAAERDSTTQLGRRLFEHLARHWSWYADFADVQVALVASDKWPNARNKPQRALAEELTVAGDNLWLFRLKSRGFCPTSHGPRRPDVTWQPSEEIQRRFGRRGQFADQLLPLLDVGPTLPAHGLREASDRLGIRGDLSPSTFRVDDARLLCQQLDHLFGERSGNIIDAAKLRTVIKPAYREMFELLSGNAASSRIGTPLAESPLLADTGDGFKFLSGQDVLYAATPGMRERSGVAGIVPTFVLEAEPRATAPLTRLFGVRVLEDALEWDPDPGECPLEPDELAAFRHGFEALVAPLLARIRVERTDERDKRVLVEFAARVEPVDELQLSCTLDGVPLDRMAGRSYFVRSSKRDDPLQAFVVWDGPAWPPAAEAAQGLAMALADALGMNLVETFLAFIQSDDNQRRRLLDIAGATGLLDEIKDELADTRSEDGSPFNELDPTPAPEAGQTSEEEAARQPIGSITPAAPPISLLQFEDITIDGEPVLVAGDLGADRDDRGDKDGAGAQGGQSADRRHAAPGIDLAALDRLGMLITMSCEVRRLRREGLPAAEILLLDGDPTNGDSLVVDVHSPETIRLAEAQSPVFKHVMLDLESRGISRLYPGFDVLTIASGEVDRLIELKSSGVDARVQTMSWNEWKSARASEIRERFWLYLVGNLRADLAHTHPFVRAIKDPFGTLTADEVQEHHVRRAVQLRVREFTVAEHLDLGIRAKRPAPERQEG